MDIYNLLHKPVRLVQIMTGHDGRGAVMATWPSVTLDVAATRTSSKGSFDAGGIKIPLVHVEYRPQTHGLPEFEVGVKYIVDRDTAVRARRAGRNVSDLLCPALIVLGGESDLTIDCAAFEVQS